MLSWKEWILNGVCITAEEEEEGGGVQPGRCNCPYIYICPTGNKFAN